MSATEPEVLPEVSDRRERLSSDARAFGLEIANAVQTELEGEAREERLQAIQEVFMRAVEYVEKRYGLITGTKWMEGANQAMRRRFDELNNLPSPHPDL